MSENDISIDQIKAELLEELEEHFKDEQRKDPVYRAKKREEIMSIKNRLQRLKAINANLDLFRKL